MSTMEQPGQKEPNPNPNSNRKRKCGPRVKTGCITCRIRRVKCDEAKPACYKCTSTGRKCDGYVQRATAADKALTVSPTENIIDYATPLSMMYAMPFSLPGTQRDRQLFHFYCVQSAFDLSVYLNSSFWHNTILQYSEHHPVVRQAVIAVGASHVYALNMNQTQLSIDASSERYEQAKQYDKALRALREHIELSDKPDPHVILICCALFFSSENGRGNREAALKHLQNGLHILNITKQKQITNQQTLHPADGSKTEISTVYEGTMNPLRSKDAEVDDELLYVFSRLDCQATLCQEDRVPVLDLDAFDEPLAGQNARFPNITHAQRRLDALHNRLAKFLTTSAEYKSNPVEELPDWLLDRKAELDKACLSWSEAMNNFVAVQNPMLKKILALERAGPERKDPEWKLAIQIQLLILHHRCWWMLFLSSYPNDPTIFTRSPNPRAEEILDTCEFLGFSLPLRPSVLPNMSEADIAWKLISEIGVAAPLFVLATKCLDTKVRDRALRQLTALREYRSGIYDQMFLSTLVESINPSIPVEDFGQAWMSTTSSFDSPDQAISPEQDEVYRTPYSDSGSSQGTRSTTIELMTNEGQSRELLGWSRKLSTT